jgi:hypothetical protein
MKVWLSYGLILVILLPVFSKLAVIGHFSANRDRISQTLCENKNRPELKCLGTCQLRNRLGESVSQGAAPRNALRTAVCELVYLDHPALPALEACILPELLFSDLFLIRNGLGHIQRPDRPPQG